MNPLCDRNPKEAKERIKADRKLIRFLSFIENSTPKELSEWIVANLLSTGEKEQLVDVLSEILNKEELSEEYERSRDRVSDLFQRVYDRFDVKRS